LQEGEKRINFLLLQYQIASREIKWNVWNLESLNKYLKKIVLKYRKEEEEEKKKKL
jgi:hypothetical protein